jgi:hypothetical protein
LDMGRSLRDRERTSGKDIGCVLEQSVEHGGGSTMVSGSSEDRSRWD